LVKLVALKSLGPKLGSSFSKEFKHLFRSPQKIPDQSWKMFLQESTKAVFEKVSLETFSHSNICRL